MTKITIKNSKQSGKKCSQISLLLYSCLENSETDKVISTADITYGPKHFSSAIYLIKQQECTQRCKNYFCAFCVCVLLRYC